MMNFEFTSSPAVGVGLLMALLYMGLGLVSGLVVYQRRSGRRVAWGVQILSWWRLFPIVSLAWFFWPWGAKALALLVGGLALRELGLHSPTPVARRQLHAIGGTCLLVQVAYALIWPHALLGLVLGLGLSCGVWAWAVGRWSCHRDAATSRQRLLLTVFFYQATGLWAAAALPASTPALAAAWFWWLCTLTALNDVAQFVTGKCLGQHKIAPTISPHKTWQGLVGGLLASALLAVGMGMALDLAPWPQLIGLGGVLGAVGFVGDMVLSAVKRRLGIKDFSQLIPGHGGILDRVDSLVLTAPTLCVWLHLHHAG